MTARRRLCLTAAVAAGALLLPAAAAGGETQTAAAEAGTERRVLRVLLTDFGPEGRPSGSLVDALRAHEERRRDPDARLRDAEPDDGWAVAILEAAQALDG